MKKIVIVIVCIVLITVLTSCKVDDEADKIPEMKTPVNTEDLINPAEPDADPPERIMLTLATLMGQIDLSSAVAHFNRTSSAYYIDVIDYSDFLIGDDWNVPLDRMILDIINGDTADIYNIYGLPFQEFAVRGLFEDLYLFLDADDELNRNDIMTNILQVAEIDGKLFNVFPYFSISTIVGNPAVLGSYNGWNIDELKAVLSANPQADLSIGDRFDKELLLSFILMFNIDEYIDWVSGTTDFNSGDFAGLLEFINTFPDSYPEHRQRLDEYELISTGRQIMTETPISSVFEYRYLRALYGGDIVFKGFPAKNRDGHAIDFLTSVAITTTSSNKQGAWEFVRMVLTEEFQSQNNILGRFPTNRVHFEEMLNESIDLNKPEFDYELVTNDDTVILMIEPFTQDQENQFLSMFDIVTRTSQRQDALLNIIMESASDFFHGKITAQDAARVIQNRVSIYVSERAR